GVTPGRAHSFPRGARGVAPRSGSAVRRRRGSAATPLGRLPRHPRMDRILARPTESAARSPPVPTRNVRSFWFLGAHATFSMKHRAWLIAGLLGCGAGLGPTPSAFEPLRTAPEVAVVTHGVRGPRLVPESPVLERSYGVEPGGGIRGIAAGVRIVSFASGA